MRPSFIGIDEAAIFVPDYSAVEKRVLAWASPNDGKALIPPMVTPLEPALEPESASVVMLRALLDERRKLRDRAKASRDSRIAQAEDAERRAAELRKRAAADETTIARADGEIAAVLADIATLGGKPEPQEG
jgi:hypothetical protein